MDLIRVVVADDHPIWLRGVAEELGAQFEIVGTAADARTAVAAIAATTPDVVLCDLNMPEGGGLAVVQACASTTKVVILTVSEAERDLLDAVAAGAVGYLLKSTDTEQLRSSLIAAARGEPVFSPTLAALVLTEFRRVAKLGRDPAALTEREREVLQLVARGHSYREVGDALFISEKTVENHVRNILQKLHLKRRQELVRYALDHGIE